MSVQRALCVVTFTLCLLASAWTSSVGWRHNLHELHEFRQIQTALTTRYLQQEGWSLAYPTPLFGPPWSVPLEFPFYQVCVARLSDITGLPIEPAGRLVSLAFLYFSLPAFYLLMRQVGVSDHRRWLFLALILVTPLYLYYSRAFMIESVALCSSAWFLHAYCRALEDRRWKWVLLASAIGVAAALSKITTLLVFFAPAALAALHHLRRCNAGTAPDPRNSLARCCAIAIGVPLFALSVGWAWVRYGDAVKSANPLTHELISANMREWNFGSLALRLDSNYWKQFWAHSTGGVLHIATLLGLLISLPFIGRTARCKVVLLLVCYAVGPLVFANLYFLHDYYFYANAVFLLGAVAVVWHRMLETPRVPAFVSWGLVIATLATQFLTFNGTYFNVQKRGDLSPPELGIALRGATEPNDVLLVYGLVWNPTLPYVSGRKAIMVTTKNEEDRAAQEQVFERLSKDATVTALVLAGASRNNHALREWVCRRFDLEPQPLLVTADINVFIAKDRVRAAVAHLASVHFNGLKVNVPADQELHGIPVHRFRVRDLPDQSVVSMFAPTPVEILAPFGVSTADVGGVLALNAHAPTVVTINVPAHAIRLTGSYGILPPAFAGPQKTDGVLFRVEGIAHDGQSSVLFEKLLNPAAAKEDQSQQLLELKLPENRFRQVVLSTLPGPANSISFDWGYWTAVQLKE